jgi:hypothetical protein
MPTPVYMLCCESQSVDAVTGLISHFNVFNQLNFEPVVAGQPIPPRSPNQTLWFRMIASATWKMDEEDRDRSFDSQIAITLPGEQEKIIGQGRFDFTKPFQRIDALIQGIQFNRAGTFLIQIRIRRVGDEGDWDRQSYPILVEATSPPQPSIN